MIDQDARDQHERDQQIAAREQLQSHALPQWDKCQVELLNLMDWMESTSIVPPVKDVSTILNCIETLYREMGTLQDILKGDK